MYVTEVTGVIISLEVPFTPNTASSVYHTHDETVGDVQLKHSQYHMWKNCEYDCPGSAPVIWSVAFFYEEKGKKTLNSMHWQHTKLQENSLYISLGIMPLSNP